MIDAPSTRECRWFSVRLTRQKVPWAFVWRTVQSHCYLGTLRDVDWSDTFQA